METALASQNSDSNTRLHEIGQRHQARKIFFVVQNAANTIGLILNFGDDEQALTRKNQVLEPNGEHLITSYVGESEEISGRETDKLIKASRLVTSI